MLFLSDEEWKSLLKEAGISDEINIGPAEVLALKVGLPIPWNKIRLLRKYVEIIYSHTSHDIQHFDVISYRRLKASNVSLAREERISCLKKDSG